MTEMSGRWYKKSTEGLRRIIADEENIKELWDETQETSRKKFENQLGSLHMQRCIPNESYIISPSNYFFNKEKHFILYINYISHTTF